jgi:hypothetical protein
MTTHLRLQELRALTLPCDVVGQYNVYIPGEGILCENGVYLDINSASGVTVFYG